MSEVKENVEEEKEEEAKEERPLSFTIVKENPRELLTFISALSKLTDEMPLILEPERIWLRAMDSAHVAMVEFEVNREYFDDYDVSYKQKINILLEKPLKFLRGIKRNETATFTPREGKLAIIISNHRRRTFTTPLLGASETELGKPKVEYPARVTIETGQLTDALSDVSKITDRVKLTVTKETFEVKGESDEGYEALTKIERSYLIDFNVKEIDKLPISATYNVEMLYSVIKELSKVFEIVNLEFGEDLPVKITGEIVEGRFTLWSAPRIE